MYFSTSKMSSSAILLLLALQRAQPVRQVGEAAHQRRVARPGLVVVERKHPGVGSRPADGTRDHGAGRDVNVIGEAEMAEDHRGGADRAVPADIRAARAARESPPGA